MAKTKHYVEYLYPGAIVTERIVKEVEERSDDVVDPPENCFGYAFFDKTETEVDKEKLTSGEKNRSGTRFFGQVYTLKEVKEKFPEKDILISNIESNNYEKVVQTRCGNFQPFKEEDKIVSSEDY